MRIINTHILHITSNILVRKEVNINFIYQFLLLISCLRNKVNKEYSQKYKNEFKYLCDEFKTIFVPLYS